MAVKKKAKKKKLAVEMTLWGVILSYPDLHDPKPYKGKIYYKTDVLFEKGHPQLAELREAIKQVKESAWGDDESEWPEEEKPLIKNGNEREDQVGYAGKRYISPSTQTPVPVVDPKGKAFNPQMVKGGMFANVAVRISSWEFDGDEGISIYLQGVQIDTSKPSLNFGGGKSVKQMFSKKDSDDEDADDEDTDQADDDSDDEDEAPRKRAKKKASRPVDEDADEDDQDDEDDEDEAPVKAKKKKASRVSDDEDEDEDEAPRKKAKKKPARDFDEDEDDEDE